jgi:hypothetical protein
MTEGLVSRAQEWYRDSSLTDASRLRLTIGDLDELDKNLQALGASVTKRLNWLVAGVFLLEATIIGALLAIALGK